MAGPGGLSGARKWTYYRGMSQAKSPEDRCADCGHSRGVQQEYTTPRCMPDAEPIQSLALEGPVEQLERTVFPNVG
jgi:hypothetical protein